MLGRGNGNLSTEMSDVGFTRAARKRVWNVSSSFFIAHICINSQNSWCDILFSCFCCCCCDDLSWRWTTHWCGLTSTVESQDGASDKTKPAIKTEPNTAEQNRSLSSNLLFLKLPDTQPTHCSTSSHAHSLSRLAWCHGGSSWGFPGEERKYNVATEAMFMILLGYFISGDSLAAPAKLLLFWFDMFIAGEWWKYPSAAGAALCSHTSRVYRSSGNIREA